MAMRSGPSANATSCSARRQRNRTGGPSGTSAIASMGSGLAKSRNGRRGASPVARMASRTALEFRAICAGNATAAASGICVSFGWKERMRCAPKRAARRSIRNAISFSSFATVSKAARFRIARSARGRERMRSKPKPGSSGSASASSFSRKSRSMILGSRVGLPVSMREPADRAIGTKEQSFQPARAFAALLEQATKRDAPARAVCRASPPARRRDRRKCVRPYNREERRAARSAFRARPRARSSAKTMPARSAPSARSVCDPSLARWS